MISSTVEESQRKGEGKRALGKKAITMGRKRLVTAYQALSGCSEKAAGAQHSTFKGLEGMITVFLWRRCMHLTTESSTRNNRFLPF
jgi:hypothetical protein